MMHFRLFAILLLLVAGSTTVVSGQTQQEPALPKRKRRNR